MPGLAADGWNHNAHYHELLLRRIPRPCARALDVGCGLGGFARKLSRAAGQVDALESDPASATQARELSAGIGNLEITQADFLQWRPEHAYDFVSMIAVLHHMPFHEALGKAAGVLRPGGVLALLGLHRPPSLISRLVWGAMALPVSRVYRWTRASSEVGAPLADPVMTLAEIRREAARYLPGAIVRRHLLWRYSLVWRRPPG